MSIDAVTGSTWPTPDASQVSFTTSEQLANQDSLDTAAVLGLAGPTPPITGAPSGVVFTPSEQLLALQSQTDAATITAAGWQTPTAGSSSLFGALNTYSLYDNAGAATELQQRNSSPPPA